MVVMYNDPSKRKKAKKNLSAEKPVKDSPDVRQSAPEFNIQKAKHEVRRLAISAIKGKTSRAEAQAALAVSLGALPAKKKPVNYKVLKQMKKKESELVQKMKDREQIFYKRVSGMAKKKDVKNKNKVIKFDANFGKVGSKTKRHSK